jgi:hypothetical protein
VTAAPPAGAAEQSAAPAQPGGIATVTGTVRVAVVASSNVTVVWAVVNTVVPWNAAPG